MFSFLYADALRCTCVRVVVLLTLSGSLIRCTYNNAVCVSRAANCQWLEEALSLHISKYFNQLGAELMFICLRNKLQIHIL